LQLIAQASNQPEFFQRVAFFRFEGIELFLPDGGLTFGQLEQFLPVLLN
jgi:hypothetical protein